MRKTFPSNVEYQNSPVFGLRINLTPSGPISITFSMVTSGRSDTGVFMGATCLVGAGEGAVVVCWAAADSAHDKNRAKSPVCLMLQLNDCICIFLINNSYCLGPPLAGRTLGAFGITFGSAMAFRL